MMPQNLQDAHLAEPVETTLSETKGSTEGLTEHPAQKEVEAPPKHPPDVDHGLVCWLQVLGSFVVWTNTLGLTNTFGVFQTFYETEYIPGEKPTNIAWIGSLQLFLMFFTGSVSGPAYDAGYFRHMMIGGNALIVFGLMMTSICTQYYQLILAQGICCGIGFGIIFTPGNAVISQYFVKRRMLASGLAASGSGFGGLIYPFVFRRLQPTIGFGWAVRVIAFLTLFLSVICVVCMRSKHTPGQIRKAFDVAALTEVPNILLTAGLFFGFMGLYVPFYYIGTYSLSARINGADMAFYYIPIINGASLASRLAITFIADTTGPFNLIIPCTTICSILCLAWIGIKSVAGLCVFAVIYGASSAIFFSLAIPCIAALTKDLRQLGQRIGTITVVLSLGVLVGTPISGAILEGGSGFVGLQVFGGVIILGGSAFLFGARFLVAGIEYRKI